MKLIQIGFGSMVSAQRLVAVVSPDSAPIKRMVQQARDQGVLIDASFGRKTKAVLIMDSGHVILSALPSTTVAGRIGGQEAGSTDGEERAQTWEEKSSADS